MLYVWGSTKSRHEGKAKCSGEARVFSVGLRFEAMSAGNLLKFNAEVCVFLCILAS